MASVNTSTRTVLCVSIKDGMTLAPYCDDKKIFCANYFSILFILFMLFYCCMIIVYLRACKY